MTAPAEPPAYSQEEVDAMYEQQDLSDQAELALEAALAGLLIAELAIASPAAVPLVQAAVLYQPIDAAFSPLGLYLMYLLLKKSGRGDVTQGLVDTSEYRAVVKSAVEQTAEKTAELINAKIARETEEPADIYARDIEGPDGSKEWAATLARTAVTNASELTSHQLAEMTGLTTKRWMTRLDEKVRASHRVLEGQDQPLGGRFQTLNGVMLFRPGDPSAPLNEIINCRCRLMYF